jgi:hypothetical protein
MSNKNITIQHKYPSNEAIRDSVYKVLSEESGVDDGENDLTVKVVQ